MLLSKALTWLGSIIGKTKKSMYLSAQINDNFATETCKKAKKKMGLKNTEKNYEIR